MAVSLRGGLFGRACTALAAHRAQIECPARPVRCGAWAGVKRAGETSLRVRSSRYVKITAPALALLTTPSH
jgi:hypothetical protein